MNIGNESIPFSQRAKNLGVLFDDKLSMHHQVNNQCKQMFCELRRIAQIANFLDKPSVQILISSFLFSRLDYCNSLLAGLSAECINKLQRFQNRAARLILRKSLRDHVTPMLTSLHWLPVKQRIDYKIALFCFKCINNKAPDYFKDLITPYIPPRQLRSANLNLLKAPSARSRVGERAFSIFAPRVWNSFPIHIRNITSENLFKEKLKTHLFKVAFDV